MYNHTHYYKKNTLVPLHFFNPLVVCSTLPWYDLGNKVFFGLSALQRSGNS